MISIRRGNETHSIISYNTSYNKEEDVYELWVTRHNGKNMKVCVEKDQESIDLVKEALDYSVAEGHPLFTF